MQERWHCSPMSAGELLEVYLSCVSSCFMVFLKAHDGACFMFVSSSFHQVKEPPSLWENPHSATTSWKPCAERHIGKISGITNLFFNKPVKLWGQFEWELLRFL